jgi:hypothetical protein
MPRTGRGQSTPAVTEQRALLWGMNGSEVLPTVAEWDPKTEPLVQALLQVVASGATVVLRPGSGGRAIGVAIWEGDVRHSPTWVYDAEELDTWAEKVNLMAEQRKRHIPG